MSNLLFFFSFAIFSKSLLTVLGTLPSPAVNWPWKVPPFGVKALPHGLDNSKERSYPHFPPPYYDYGGLACFIARFTPLSHTAGSADGVLTSRLLCSPCLLFGVAGRAAPVSRPRPQAGLSVNGFRPLTSHLIQIRFPSQGWLTVVSLPPVSVGYSLLSQTSVIECAHRWFTMKIEALPRFTIQKPKFAIGTTRFVGSFTRHAGR